jgi:hypothetical protein
MTRTKEQLRKAVFGKLQCLRRKLVARGVPCSYTRSVLSHDSGDIGFTITCRLADDQATPLPQIVVHTAEGTQTFDHLTFEQGLARLQVLFRDQGGDNTDEAGDGTQTNTNGQPSHGDTLLGNGCVADPENHTPFGHEGDSK